MNPSLRSLHLRLILMVLAALPLHGRAEPAGGTGGISFDMDCPDDQFLVGISGTTGWYVDELRIFCGAYDATGTFMEDTFAPNGNDIAGSPGNAFYLQMCNASQVITGFTGLAGIYIDAIASFCSETDGTGMQVLGPDGGLGGTPFFQTCPPGQVANGVRGRADWWIDQVEIKCGDFCTTPPAEIIAVTPVDGANGLQPTFVWETPGFDTLVGMQFQLCVFTIPFDNCDILDQMVNGTNFTPTQPLDFAGQPSVGWAVRTVNTCGDVSPFSESRLLNAAGPGTAGPGGPDYRPLCQVYKDDRCSICHGGPQPEDHSVAFPAQNDEQGRFNDDDCTGCHFVVHPDNGQNVWEFPPGPSEEFTGADLQTFADPATCGDICRSVRNWAEREGHDFIHHIEVDPLVAYGFNPATVQANDTLAQAAPVQVMSHADYIDLSTSWYRAGMPCDPVNDNFPGQDTSAAANAGADGQTSKRLPPIPPGKVKVPDIGAAWWIKPDVGKPNFDRLSKQTGIPPECARLIRQPGRADLTLHSRKRALRPDLIRHDSDLVEVCKALLGK